MYPWLVLLHVLGVFGFLMAHGISSGVALSLRRERNLARIQALLKLSGSTLGLMHSSIGILFLAGLIAGFMGKWWGRVWIWASLVLFLAMYIFMNVAAARYYSQVRKAVGLEYRDGMKEHAPVDAASPEDIDALLNNSMPLILTVTGFGSIVVITWLMIFKPF